MLGAVTGSWHVVELRTAEGLVPTVPDSVRLDLADGSVRGHSGVNRIEGAYQAHGSSLSFGPLRTTRMAGADQLIAQETALLADLHDVACWSDEGETVAFCDAAGRVLLRVAPQVAQLRPGSSWLVTEFRIDPATVAATDAEHPPTLALGADGRVTGTLGANRFSGEYVLDGEALSFGVLASTRMMPPPPLDVQEAAVTTALGEVASARVESGRLVLRAGDGRGVLWAVPDG